MIILLRRYLESFQLLQAPARHTNTSTYFFQIDVEGLNIVVSSSAVDSTDDTSKSKTKGKSKAKAAGRELISDGHLRLKAGIHYGLLGRNGTGKSSENFTSPVMPI